MKTSFAILFLLTQSIVGLSQDFNQSGPCHDNANCGWSSSLENIKRAVFTYSTGSGSCTGTLVNQNVGQDQLQQYFITAKHCIDGVNFSADWTFYFNYQSPDCNSESVPDVTNINGSNRSGTRYMHQSRVTLIDELGISDFAILKIEKPIPPHFNVYYAGWSVGFGQVFQFPNYVIHHPRGDIKKIAKTYNTSTFTNYPCHVVTEVVDVVVNFLFGWAVKKEIRTRTVCSYVESPFYTVAAWNDGVMENGSSGSALLNNDGKIIGTLQGGLGSCDFPALEFFGRFNTSYNKSAATRSVLKAGSSTTSIGGRQILTYQTLENLSGTYYPAGDYQSTNQIKLKATGQITTKPVTGTTLKIVNGADFVFESGDKIVLNSGFHAQAGSTFSARISQQGGQRIGDEEWPQPEMTNPITEILAIEIPQEKKFDANKYIADFAGELKDDSFVSIYPNPSDGLFTIGIALPEQEEGLEISIVSAVGSEVIHIAEGDFRSGELKIDLRDQPPGVYLIRIKYSSREFIERITLSH